MRSGAVAAAAILLALPPLLARPAAAHAQGASPSRNDPRPRAQAARRTAAVVVDGRLDDAGWGAAPAIGELRQQSPDEGKPPTQRTELRILYDDDALYVGARMYDSLGVRALLTRRDQLIYGGSGYTSDKIALVLDPYHDRSTRAWFELNPLGVKGDHLNDDTSWDPVWQGAAHVDSLGWTAEFRIPLSQLRFSRDSVQTWGLQVWRTISRRNESDMWAFWRLNESGGPAFFGTLEGLRIPTQPRQLELLPYAVSSGRFEHASADDPFRSDRELSARLGGDVKYNLTSNLTLDATVNPDFGQVETDPAVLNLSAYETIFQEKRPFFIANSGAFSFGSFSCFFCSNVSSLGVFYSRRIGRAPQLAGIIGDRSRFMDAPDATAILGAAKITGRTRNGWSVGLLDAVTNRETARFVPKGDGPVQTALVEPRTNYFVGRLRKDLRQGDTRLGMITTLTNRALGSDTVARSRLRSHAELVGVDLVNYWAKRRYSLLAQLAVSSVAGDTAAMRRTQLSSTHWFQRPGRTTTSDGIFDVAFDPARTRLGGYGFYARAAKDQGDWLWEASQNWRSPGFEVNDLGAQSRADYRWMNANVVRRWTKPGRWYRDAWTTLGGQQQFNYEGDRTDAQAQLYGSMTFLNFWSAYAFGIHRPRSYDDRLLRGGPTVKGTGYNYFSGGVDGDSRQPVFWGFGTDIAQSIGSRGWSASVYPRLTLKPSVRLLLSFSPSYGRDVTVNQYVDAFDDPAATAFGGRRYVFGTVDQTTLAMEMRANATFTPTLTLEAFVQPFLASGRYTDFKEFAAPRSGRTLVYGRDAGTICASTTADGGREYAFNPTQPVSCDLTGAQRDAALPFGFGDPNFNVRSLRGTAVLRWEYRPGSTLFLVWTQTRDGSDAFGDFDFRRERAALFRERPTNVLQIKASYWVGL